MTKSCAAAIFLAFDDTAAVTRLAFCSSSGSGPTTLTPGSRRNTLVAASYTFSTVKAYVSHARNRGLGTADSHDTLAGVLLPFGRHKVMLSHVRHDDKARANQDARQWGVGYLYALSRRTDLYAAYAVIGNDNGAAFTVGSATEKGSGDRAANLGVRHSF